MLTSLKKKTNIENSHENLNVASINHDAVAEENNTRNLENSSKNPNVTSIKQQSDKYLEPLEANRNKPLTKNVRARKTGVGVPARMIDRVPIGDLKKEKHENELEKEIGYRHLLPYLAAASNGGKQTHPLRTHQQLHFPSSNNNDDNKSTLLGLKWQDEKKIQATHLY